MFYFLLENRWSLNNNEKIIIQLLKVLLGYILRQKTIIKTLHNLPDEVRPVIMTLNLCDFIFLTRFCKNLYF